MDTCDPEPVVICEPPSGTVFPPGDNTVTCTAIDAHGNESECQFIVRVVDTTPPDITCPESMIVECATPDGAMATFTASASDLCDPEVVVSCEPPSGSVFPPGSTLVTCTATDASGNSSECQFEVNVVDTTPPSITCPQDAIVIECENLVGIARYPLPVVQDACDAEPTVTCEPPPETELPVGTHTITCTATDADGNSAECSFDIEIVDTAPPELVCPDDIRRECVGPDGAVVEYSLPTTADSCDPAPNLSCLPASGSLFPIGETTVTCTADDANGNMIECSFVVTVEDTTPPAIQCPQDIVEMCATPDGTVVSYTATATDVCDPTPIVSCEPPSGSLFPVGTTTVVCTATDNAGNSSMCEFTVTVQDTAPPTLSCPEDFERECMENGVALVEYPVPTAMDDCDPAPTVVCEPPSGSLLPPGPHVITCTATDAAGNTASCEFLVTVVDVTPPELVCPGDITAECTSPDGAVVEYDLPVANDACDGQPPVTCEPPSGSIFPLGLTEVVCSSTDRAGNTTNCSFMVTVVDTRPPTLECPEEIVVQCTSADGAEVVFETGVSDICDASPSLSCDPPSGSTFPEGQTTVICTASDSEGNISECSFTVTVVDRTGPTMTCPPNMTAECTTSGEEPHKPAGWPPGSNPPPNACTAIVEFDPPLAADECQDGELQVTCSPPSGSRLEMGLHTVVCRARDAAGNETTCEFTIDVVLGANAFIRGDVNDDSSVNIGDPIMCINFLFLGFSAPTCMDAADCNDDGDLNLADPVFGLTYIFLGGTPPPAPFLPLCGLDPTEGDNYDCVRYRACE